MSKTQDSLFTCPLPFPTRTLAVLRVCYGFTVRMNRTHRQTCSPLSTQVSKANGWVQTGSSSWKFQGGKPPPSLSSLLGHRPNCNKHLSYKQGPNSLFSYLKTTSFSYQLSTGFGCFPPHNTPQDNLSSDRISFVLVISFYGPASPSRCKTRNINSNCLK